MSRAPEPEGRTASASIALIRERIESLPEHLADVAGRPWDDAVRALGEDVVVTGVGASAGPARLFAWLLAHRLRIAARFAPISAFAGSAAPAGKTLVIVSQGLSPNARFALRHTGSFERVLVLTSTRPANTGPAQILAEVQAAGGTVVVLPPPEENVTLLRVVGPAAAALAACLIVEHARGSQEIGAIVKELPGALATSKERALAAAAHVESALFDGPCAMVSVGIDPAASHAHRWKWLEGLRALEPFGWDLLEIAHGPIQSAARPMPFVVLAGADGGADDLIERLGRVIAPAGHALVVLRSALPEPLSFVDHDAQLDAVLLRVLLERPRDLRASACGANDEPLYSIGSDR